MASFLANATLWMLSLVGFVYFVTQSSIFARWRIMVSFYTFAEGALGSRFLYCPMCTAFWIGAGLAIGGVHPFWMTTTESPSLFQMLWVVVTHGFAAMGAIQLHRASIEGAAGVFQAEHAAVLEQRALAQSDSSTQESDDDQAQATTGGESGHRDGRDGGAGSV